MSSSTMDNARPSTAGPGAPVRGFFSHHKTASTWGRLILGDAMHALRLRQAPIMSPPHWAGYDSPGDMVRATNPDIIIVTDPTAKLMADLPPVTGFHLIRDPRDILVSSYFSHRNSHPTKFWDVEWKELVPHREKLLKLDHDEGIMAEIEFSGWMIDTLGTWDYQMPGMLEIKMEEFTADPLTWWTRIFTQMDMLAGEDDGEFAAYARVKWNLASRIGVPKSVSLLRRALRIKRVPIKRLPPAYLPWVLERFSFENLSGGRRVGQVDEGSHYRRGVPGDWRNHLNADHLAAFRDRFGDLAERLGYES